HQHHCDGGRAERPLVRNSCWCRRHSSPWAGVGADYCYCFWQCAQVPAISTTLIFGAKPVARAAALTLCATGAAGISPTEPQRSQIKNATIEVASWSYAQARYALRLSVRWTRPRAVRESSG